MTKRNQTSVLAYSTDPAAPIRVLEFMAPGHHRLRVTVYTAPLLNEATREQAAANPGYVMVEDLGPA